MKKVLTLCNDEGCVQLSAFVTTKVLGIPPAKIATIPVNRVRCALLTIVAWDRSPQN